MAREREGSGGREEGRDGVVEALEGREGKTPWIVKRGKREIEEERKESSV